MDAEHAPDEVHRIVLVGPVYPYRGGIAHFTEMTYQGLSARGHEVSAVSFKRQYPSFFFPGKSQYETEAAPETFDAPRLIDTLNPFSWGKAARHILRLEPDAVIFQYWMPFFAPAYSYIARRLRKQGIPRLAVVHNALPHERHIGDTWLSRRFLRRCDGLVVMSDAVAEDVQRLVGSTMPVRRIEHPVYERFGAPVPRDEARTALGLDPSAPVILFFGFIRPYKGLDVLLEALPRINDRLPDLHLVVAGEFYDEPEAYKALIRRHNLGPHVHLHDHYIPTEEVPRYFAAADLAVQPYVSATQSGVAQVAFNFDTPLVVTDVGGLAEVVPHEEAGLVVPPNDPEALADAVIRYFCEGMRDELVEGVRTQKRRYAPARLYEAIEALIEETGSKS